MNMSTKKKQISVISALAEGALILAAVLVSWCAIALGADTAQPQSARPYPIGVWGPFGVGHDIDPGIVNNLGIVGIGISDDWDNVNTAPGVYNWSTLDGRIAQAKAAGFQYIGRVAQIGPDWKEKSTQAGGDVLTECSHHDGTTEERAAAV